MGKDGYMYKERIANLMKAVKGTEYEQDDLEFIESRMNTFTGYMSHDAWMEVRMQRLQIEGVDGEYWRDTAMDLDKTRRMKHDLAMDAINQLNRMSKMYELEPFYDGPVDHEHRTKVGDVISDIVNEYFKDRDPGKLEKKDLMDDFAEAVESIPKETFAIKK